MRWGGLAFGVALLVLGGLWVMTGDGLITRPHKPVAFTTVVGGQGDTIAPTVLVALSRAQSFTASIRVRATTRADRLATVRSEVEGRVAEQFVDEGEQIAAGATIVRISDNGASAHLREVEALVRQRELEHQAAAKLNRQGYRSQTQLAEAAAQLEAARAERVRARKSVADRDVQSPFAGVVTERPVELGDYLRKGDPVAAIADLSRIRAEGYVSERERSQITAGQTATARMLDGTEHQGTVRFVASVADSRTRTYRIEVVLENRDGVLFAGQSTELTIDQAEVRAHKVPASWLIVGQVGELGLHELGEEDQVRFVAVEVLAQDVEGVWVSGLPAEVRLLADHQHDLNEGDRVQPRDGGRLVNARVAQ